MVLRRFLMAALAMAVAMLCVPVVEAQTPAATQSSNNGWRDYMWPTILDITNTKP